MDNSDSAAVTITRPGVADIDFIMAAERTDGFENLVGRSDETWHRIALVDPRYAYFLALCDEPIGFVILRDWNAPEQVTHIKRIVITKPGKGFGKAFLNLILDEVFGTTQAYRLSLGLFPHNLRARRAYEGVGFKSEGVSRGSAFFGGVNHDELVMAMLKPEWRALRGLA
jgi:RimJ/RimL family protein N-acetyltransferase